MIKLWRISVSVLGFLENKNEEFAASKVHSMSIKSIKYRGIPLQITRSKSFVFFYREIIVYMSIKIQNSEYDVQNVSSKMY